MIYIYVRPIRHTMGIHDIQCQAPLSLVDAIDAHVTFQSVEPSHFDRPLGRVPVTVVRSVLFVMCVSSRRITCRHHDSRFCVRTEFIGVTFAFPLIVSFLILSFLVFP